MLACEDNVMYNSAIMYETQNVPSILFKKRTEKIDWRRLAAVDVDEVIKKVDVNTLQELLKSIAFCDVKLEIDSKNVDPGYIKLYQIAQLTIEYLLYSQDYLTSTIESFKEENETLQNQNAKLKQQIHEKNNRLTLVRRECHRRRLLLLAQQQLMNSTPSTYHPCAYCSKSFLTPAFLAAHTHRRHPEMEFHKPVGIENAGLKLQQEPCFVNTTQSYQQLGINQSSLENDAKMLLKRLRTEGFQENCYGDDESHARSTSLRLRRRRSSRSIERENYEWQQKLVEEHKNDMELLRRTFTQELNDLRLLYETTQRELEHLKSRPLHSNLGELEDDTRMDITCNNENDEIDNNHLTLSSLEKVDLDNSTFINQTDFNSNNNVRNLNKRLTDKQFAALNTSANNSITFRSFCKHKILKQLNGKGKTVDIHNRYTQKELEKISFESVDLLSSTRQSDLISITTNDFVERKPHVTASSLWTDQPVKHYESYKRSSKLVDRQMRIDQMPIAKVNRTCSPIHQPYQTKHIGSENDLNTTQITHIVNVYKDNEDVNNGNFSNAINEPLNASSGSSPSRSLHATESQQNVLRYSRLLDELRADPDTLQRLRHEVEQLLIEQLTERGIKSNQSRLSTPELNERLNLLGKEREYLAKKHAHFYKIRDDLHQHVNRLARARMGGSVTNLSEGRWSGKTVVDGVLPPTGFSPGSTRRSVVLSMSGQQRSNIASPLGVSMPVLNSQHTNQLNASNLHAMSDVRVNLQNSSSPQLRYAPSSSLGTIRTKSSSSVRRNLLTNTSQMNSTANLNRQHTLPHLTTLQSSDDWNSVSEDNEFVGQTRRNQSPLKLSPKRTKNANKLSDVEVNSVDQMIADLEEESSLSLQQRKQPISKSPVKASTTTISKTGQAAQYSMRVNLTKTDDEDICSVSSINGNMSDHNSLSLAGDQFVRPQRQPLTSHSVDPNLIKSSAVSDMGQQRPSTRFGKPNGSTRQTSTGSLELSNTAATSLWGTYSKAPSPNTNILSLGRSDDVGLCGIGNKNDVDDDDDDFDSDD